MRAFPGPPRHCHSCLRIEPSSTHWRGHSGKARFRLRLPQGRKNLCGFPRWWMRRVRARGPLHHQYVDKNRPSRPVFCCPESRVVAGFRAVLPVPRGSGTSPGRGPVRLPFPISSPLTLTNRPRLAPAEPLSWRAVTRASRRAVGIDDWSSNRVARTEGGRQSPGRTWHAV